MQCDTNAKGVFLPGKEGGILNAILGSLYLAAGGTVLAFLFSVPLALCLRSYLRRQPHWASIVRLSLDVLWGIPSIVYGAFGFIIMALVGLHASLLGGIIVLALLEMPIMTRAMDEVIQMIRMVLKRLHWPSALLDWKLLFMS